MALVRKRLDVVVFDEIPDGPGSMGTGPARLRIVGRHRHFINAFGEEVIVTNAEEALAKACSSHQCSVRDFQRLFLKTEFYFYDGQGSNLSK